MNSVYPGGMHNSMIVCREGEGDNWQGGRWLWLNTSKGEKGLGTPQEVGKKDGKGDFHERGKQKSKIEEEILEHICKNTNICNSKSTQKQAM